LKYAQEKVPDAFTKIGEAVSGAPSQTYEVDHVYGFAGDRNKSMLYFGKDNNEIVFSCAALGVV